MRNLPKNSLSNYVDTTVYKSSLVELIVVISLLWVLLSGIFDSILVNMMGVVSIIVVVWLQARMQRLEDNNLIPPYHLLLVYLPYWFWLFKEMFKSNVAVSRHVWSHQPVRPAQRWLPCQHQTAVGRVTYANSITLTPGTLAIDLDPGIILVQSLDEALLDELANGEMHDRLIALEPNQVQKPQQGPEQVVVPAQSRQHDKADH